MIRGHCGPILFSRSIPIIARVTFRRIEDPFEESSDSTTSATQAINEASSEDSSASSSLDTSETWSHSEAEGVARAMDSLLALGHPLALFRDDLPGLRRWHEARMTALETLRRAVLLTGNEDSSSLSLSDVEGQDPAVTSAVAAAREGRGLDEDPFRLNADEDRSEPEDLMLEGAPDEADWTPMNMAGLALLSVAFGLLVTMLLLSLSNLIYGCNEETESFLPPETTIDTPLLKWLQAGEVVDKATPDSDAKCVYEPPSQK